MTNHNDYYVFEHHEPEQVWEWIDSGKKVIHTETHSIQIHRPRLSVYRTKGCMCIACGREGTFFRSEVHVKTPSCLTWYFHPYDNPPPLTHLNLYGIGHTGVEFMLTADHIIPRSLGGSNRLENLIPLCFNCNSMKGNDRTWIDDLPKNRLGFLMSRPAKQKAGKTGNPKKKEVYYA